MAAASGRDCSRAEHGVAGFGWPRDTVHLMSAARDECDSTTGSRHPTLRSESTAGFRVVTLAALVRMKLTLFRDRDRVHLRDLIEVGLVDASWVDALSPVLPERLREMLASPDG